MLKKTVIVTMPLKKTTKEPLEQAHVLLVPFDRFHEEHQHDVSNEINNWNSVGKCPLMAFAERSRYIMLVNAPKSLDNDSDNLQPCRINDWTSGGEFVVGVVGVNVVDNVVGVGVVVMPAHNDTELSDPHNDHLSLFV